MTDLSRIPLLLLPIGLLVACEAGTGGDENHLEELSQLIIVPDDLLDELRPLADWRCATGTPTALVALDDALDAGTGPDDAARLRDYVQGVWEEHELKYLLLAGDAGVMPVRQVHVTVHMDAEDTNEEADVASDLYFADLDGDWDPDGDEVYGEITDTADLLPDLAVGRLPAETWEEARNYVNKVLKYEGSPSTDYQDRALLSAGYAGMGAYGSLGMDMFIIPEMPAHIQLTKLYEDWENFDDAEALTAENFVAALEDGQNVTWQMGHGYEKSIGPLMEIEEIEDLDNNSRPTVLITTECLGGRFDYWLHDTSGEVFVLDDAGGVAYIGHSHLGMGFPSFSLVMQIMARCMYTEGENPNRLGDCLVQAQREYSPGDNLYTAGHPDRWNQFVNIILGDPALAVWTDQPRPVDLEVETSGQRSATFTVRTRDGDRAVNALVTAHLRGEFLLMAHTDSDGKATLTGADKAFTEATFTVSRRDLVPATWTWED